MCVTTTPACASGIEACGYREKRTGRQQLDADRRAGGYQGRSVETAWMHEAAAEYVAAHGRSDMGGIGGEDMRATIDGIGTLIESMAGASIAERAEFVNEVRELLHEISPFKTEPVDFVRWVPADQVHANDYNPNSVAPPEMELLRVSIMADGYTQPIVAMPEGNGVTVIDGFHRNRVGRECKDVQARIHGFLPVVRINASQEDRGDRIASTIRHNRARGKHKVEAMSDIVVELRRRNWSEEKIGKQLGMDPDEVLRLCQISGLAEMFADAQFSEAWEPGTVDDEALASLSFEESEDE